MIDNRRHLECDSLNSPRVWGGRGTENIPCRRRIRVPAGVVHEEKNITVNTTTVHALVAEKGKKLLQPYTKP